MPLPTSKIELLDNLKQAYQKLDSELDSIDSSSQRLTQIDGDISCCDVLAYQIGWGRLLLGWEQQEANGAIPPMPAEGFKWSQQKELAQSFYLANSDKTLDQLRKEFSECYDAIVAWIDSLSDEDLFVPRQLDWTGEKWAIVKWIQVNTIAPYRSARTRIRRWKRASAA